MISEPPQVPACLDIGRPQFQVRMQDVTYDHQAPYCNSIASAYHAWMLVAFGFFS